MLLKTCNLNNPPFQLIASDVHLSLWLQYVHAGTSGSTSTSTFRAGSTCDSTCPGYTPNIWRIGMHSIFNVQCSMFNVQCSHSAIRTSWPTCTCQGPECTCIPTSWSSAWEMSVLSKLRASPTLIKHLNHSKIHDLPIPAVLSATWIDLSSTLKLKWHY